MNNSHGTVHEPLFHIAKRGKLHIKWKILIYAVATVVSLLIGGLIISASSTKGDPIMFFTSLFDGCLGSPRKSWLFFQQLALLLCVSMALVPAFKMKFWNLGANGQILVGGLAAIACMKFMGEAGWKDGLIIACSLIASMLAGAIWAVIPAICKAIWKTNESLFTLMLNYIATGLVSYFIALWVKSGSGVMQPIPHGNLPEVYNQYLLIILAGAIVTAFMFVYLKFTKHGYELSVVGDSENTAKYIGISVKKVIIRTLILSGMICGLVGFFLTAGMSHTIGTKTAQNMGFTAIMTTWLGNCNPLMIILTCGLVAFITRGMQQVRMDFALANDSISNLIIGLVYFFIIACAFFIDYKIIFNKKRKKQNDFVSGDAQNTATNTENKEKEVV